MCLSRAYHAGMNIDEIRDLLVAHGCREVIRVNASDCTADKFRQDAIGALSRSDSSKAIIVNYHMMSLLGQNLPFGHHSPLGAYHAPSDRLLILDTWPATVECWVTVELLHAAMNTVDNETGRTRGYCVVEF
jgi:Phytochelatin synthase